MGLRLTAAVGDWLLELGLFTEAELAAPPLDNYILNKQASNEFENGVRVAQLLDQLGAAGSAEPLKENNAPVAKLYNWNLLLPRLRRHGLDVDQDMKVLIVAGDTDIVVDLLEQLNQISGARLPQRSEPIGAEASSNEEATSIQPPASPAAATSAVQLLACACKQELAVSWTQAVHLARHPKQLARQQAVGVHGTRGGFIPLVRWYKFLFAHCKHLAALCAPDPAETELALDAVCGGLSSTDTEVALWCARLLCRLASELTTRGAASLIWIWFAKQGGSGAAATVDAWRHHPELHAAGALMPIVLHFAGSENLHACCATVLPRHLSSPSSYLAFALELTPLLASTSSTKELTYQSGTLKHILTTALGACRRPLSPPSTRGLALELLADLWSRFTVELQSLSLDADDAVPPNDLAAFSSEVLSLNESGAAAGVSADAVAPMAKDAGSVVLRELKKGCRDPDFELQLTSHMALFRLLDQFASASHPGAPYLFNVLAFSMIENHHEPVLRHFLSRNMQLCLQQQPYIPVGVLLKPLVKQATLYGYNNCDFDFFLTLAKHQRLGLRHALLMMQFLGKVCLNDALHGRIASIPFLVLVERFHDSEVLHDFLEIFCEQALATLVPETASDGMPKAAEASAIRSTLCIELVAKLLHLPHAALLARVAPAVHSAAQQYVAIRGVEHPGLIALLHFAESARPEVPPASLNLPPPTDADFEPVTAAPAKPTGKGGDKGGDKGGFNVRPAHERGRAKRGTDEKLENVESEGGKLPPALPPAAKQVKASGPGYGAKAGAKAAAAGGANRPPPAIKAKEPFADDDQDLAELEEEQLRELEGEIEEKLKALERVEAEAKAGGAAPEGSSKKEQREAFVKVQREVKDERTKLQKEKQKIKEARIKRRTRAKYDAKLKALKTGAAEDEDVDESGGKTGYAARAKPSGKKPPAEAPKKDDGPPNLNKAEIRKVEKALAQAADPNTVELPPGYLAENCEVDGEAHVVPASLGLAPALQYSLEILDEVVFHVAKEHVLEPVPIVRTEIKLKRDPDAPAGPPAPPEPKPKPAPRGRKPNITKPAPAAAASSRTSRRSTSSRPAAASKSPVRQPATSEAADSRAKSTSPPRSRPAASRPKPKPKASPKLPAASSTAEPDAEPAAAAEGGEAAKAGAAATAAKGARAPRAVQLTSEEKARREEERKKDEERKAKEAELFAEANPLRADVKKFKAEQERVKIIQERDDKLRKRHEEQKKKLVDYQDEKRRKEAEKAKEAEDKKQAAEEEARKKRERDRKRQEANKKKLENYKSRSGSGEEGASPTAEQESSKAPPKAPTSPKKAAASDSAAAPTATGGGNAAPDAGGGDAAPDAGGGDAAPDAGGGDAAPDAGEAQSASPPPSPPPADVEPPPADVEQPAGQPSDADGGEPGAGGDALAEVNAEGDA